MPGFYDTFFPGGFFPDRFWPDRFWPGAEEEEELSMRCQDTTVILEDWAEVLTVKRGAVIYQNDAIAESYSWSTIQSFAGDWQPASGNTMRKEAKLAVKSKARVFVPCNVSVEENDRIYREDGSFMYVNYVTQYEDHATLFLKRIEDSN